MAYSTIDVGPGAVSLGSPSYCGGTMVDAANSANASGILNSFEIYVDTNNLTGVKMGSFSGSGTSYTNRAYENIGSVTAGSKQTFTGKNCAVVTGDFLGVVVGGAAGDGYPYIQKDTGGTQAYYYAADAFGGGTLTYTDWGVGRRVGVYATGVTIPDAPTSVSATDTLTDKVTITWTAGTGETGGHRVYRNGADISGVIAHGTSTYDDTGGTVGTTYAYTVKAINDAGLSSASSADNGTRVSSFVPQILIAGF